jgi:putative addiction module antidote
MTTVKITAIGNSSGVVLPKEILGKLHAERGDTLYIIETANGIELTPFDPKIADQLDKADLIIRQNRDVLKKLAE